MANPYKVPLNALRAIEIVGRGGTLSAAARELGVTPGAVSQHIRRAEQRFGFVLFERGRDGLSPTPALEAALPDFARGFAALADGVAAIAAHRHGRLTVATGPAFAARWLVPRLGRFTRDHPALEIRLVTAAALADLHHSDIDCAIRLGRGAWPDVVAEPLLPQFFFPVAAPQLARRLVTPADLSTVPIVHDEGSMVAWADWFAAAGVIAPPPLAGPHFSDPILALEATLAGQGVMLAWDGVVADALARGLLVRPFSLAVDACIGYWFVTTQAGRRSPKARALLDWLKREIAADAAAP